jgi:hypothetical protein
MSGVGAGCGMRDAGNPKPAVRDEKKRADGANPEKMRIFAVPSVTREMWKDLD